MSRLIYADEAKENACKWECGGDPSCPYSKSNGITHEQCEFMRAIDECRSIDAAPAATTVFGKWIKDNSIGMSPGGTPGYVCSQCGGSFHLHGAEYPRRKMICDKCGSINSYPWEKTYEEEATE